MGQETAQDKLETAYGKEKIDISLVEVLEFGGLTIDRKGKIKS